MASESLWLAEIEKSSGIEKQVLSDAYRQLVLGNFSSFNKKSGKNALPEMDDSDFLDHGTLPNFKRKSGQYRGSDTLVFNIKRNQNVWGYRVLAGRVYDLIEKKILTELQVEKGFATDFEDSEFSTAEEVDATKTPETYEGAVKRILVNRYERSKDARKECIDHYGSYKCRACCFDFAATYGEIGNEFIHVHHLAPLSKIGREYKIDGKNDLVPVCPNCHEMLHKKDPPYTIEELKEIIDAQKTKNQ